jgi:4-hydroxymandelate oxidase
MEKIINLASLEQLARPRLSKMSFDFVAGGSDDEWTLRRNMAAWHDTELLPRVLRYSRERSLETTLLGQRLAHPILMAPMGFQCLAHPEGEVAAARGAAAAKAVYVLSTTSTKSIEEVAQESQGPKWFQLYVYKDRSITKNLVERAVAAGYQALCLTVDTPIEGRREKDKLNQFRLPAGLTIANFRDNPALNDIGGADRESALTKYIESQWETGLSWDDVDWLARLSRLPLVLKGILSARDAELAVQHGIAAIIVSNHGGRQLDGVPATAEVLEAVVDAVGNRGEVLVDGGIRRGTHVLRALAMGARAVLVGRPLFWALALGGADGVAAALEHLRGELSEAMELAGCRSTAEISRELLRRSSP